MKSEQDELNAWLLAGFKVQNKISIPHADFLKISYQIYFISWTLCY